jgi:hypothetical protein
MMVTKLGPNHSLGLVETCFLGEPGTAPVPRTERRVFSARKPLKTRWKEIDEIKPANFQGAEINSLPALPAEANRALAQEGHFLSVFCRPICTKFVTAFSLRVGICIVVFSTSFY